MGLPPSVLGRSRTDQVRARQNGARKPERRTDRGAEAASRLVRRPWFGNAVEQAAAGLFRRLRNVDLSQSALPSGPPGRGERRGVSVGGERRDLAPPADPLSRG